MEFVGGGCCYEYEMVRKVLFPGFQSCTFCGADAGDESHQRLLNVADSLLRTIAA